MKKIEKLTKEELSEFNVKELVTIAAPLAPAQAIEVLAGGGD